MAQGRAERGAEPEAGVGGWVWGMKDTVGFRKLSRRHLRASERLQGMGPAPGLRGALTGVGPGVP